MLRVGEIQVVAEQMICAGAVPILRKWTEDLEPGGERWGRVYPDISGEGHLGSGYYCGYGNGDGVGGVDTKEIPDDRLHSIFHW